MSYEPDVRYKRNGVPILKNEDIEAHAECFVEEFDRQIFREPHALDIEGFMEFHLGLVPEYNYLTHCGLILGRMVFNETDKMPIYVPAEGRAEYIHVDRGVVMLDNTLLDDEHRLRSTVGHECGHWIYHKPYYSIDPFQMTLFENLEQKATACRTADIEGSGKKTLDSANDWLEHHAKYFSAAVLMPKRAFINAMKDTSLSSLAYDFCHDNGSAGEYLAMELADVFNVSKASAAIRLSMFKEEITERLFPRPITSYFIFDTAMEYSM